MALCQGPGPLEHCGPAASVPAVGSRFCSLEFEMGTSVVWEMSGLSQMPDGAEWVCFRGMGAAQTLQWVYSTCIVHFQYVFTVIVIKLHYVIKLTVYAFSHSPGH